MTVMDSAVAPFLKLQQKFLLVLIRWLKLRPPHDGEAACLQRGQLRGSGGSSTNIFSDHNSNSQQKLLVRLAVQMLQHLVLP